MEPSFWKLYARHLLMILLGAIPLALVWEVENRWIALPLGLLSILFILLQLNIIQKIADAHAAYLRYKKDKANFMQPAEEPASQLKQKVVYNTWMVLFYICMIPIAVTGKKVENFLEWQPLLTDIFKLSWIPFLVAWLYNKRFKVIFGNKDKQDHVLMATFVIPLVLLFHAMVWYNHLQPSPVIARNFIAVSETGSNIRYGNKYLFINIDGEKKRFEVPRKLYENIQENDTLLITVKAGALGYPYIDRFERHSAPAGQITH